MKNTTRNPWVNCVGRIKVFKQKKIIIQTPKDLIHYYHWFISRRYFCKLNFPKHGSHITIASRDLHKNVNWGKTFSFDKKRINFQYSVKIRGALSRKGFYGFYLDVKCPMAEKIKKEIGAKDNLTFLGFHVSVANTKNRQITNHFPELITINERGKRR